MARKKKLYWVNIYTEGGWCYRSVYDVEWKDVLELRRQAKACGEHIDYEVWREC